MEKLNMSMDEIKSNISLIKDSWKNYSTTNCYAYALGLDLPEEKISENAYQVGIIGAQLFGFDYVDLRMMPYEDRLKMDLFALEIELKEASPDFNAVIKPYYVNGKKIFTEYTWPIALFESDANVHFLRKKKDGTWYHKYGYGSSIINTDMNGKIITDPEECDLRKYKYKKTFLLTHAVEN